MLVDWLVYGLLVFGAAKLLNSTLFKLKPASRSTAWVLTILIFVVSIVALTVLKVLRYKIISDSVGVSINLKNPLDMSGAFVFAWLFFSLLKREEKNKQQPSTSEPPVNVVSHTMSMPPTESVTPTVASNYSEQKPQLTLVASVTDEGLWAQALEEFESSSRRAGLWARVFAEANGDESLAKAGYLRLRVDELESEKQKLFAIEHQKQIDIAREIELENLRVKEALRQEALIAEQKAYELLPKGVCPNPNCGAVIPLSLTTCSSCYTVLASTGKWSIKPLVEL